MHKKTNQKKPTPALFSLRKNQISQSANVSFNKSSFLELKDGTIKRIRQKQSYKDLFLEKQNFVPTPMPHSKGRDPSYSSMYQNRNSFMSSSEDNSFNDGNISQFQSRKNIKTIDTSFSNSQKRLKTLSFANTLRNKLNLTEKKNLMKKARRKIHKEEDVESKTNNILGDIDNEIGRASCRERECQYV